MVSGSRHEYTVNLDAFPIIFLAQDRRNAAVNFITASEVTVFGIFVSTSTLADGGGVTSHFGATGPTFVDSGFYSATFVFGGRSLFDVCHVRCKLSLQRHGMRIKL